MLLKLKPRPPFPINKNKSDEVESLSISKLGEQLRQKSKVKDWKK